VYLRQVGSYITDWTRGLPLSSFLVRLRLNEPERKTWVRFFREPKTIEKIQKNFQIWEFLIDRVLRRKEAMWGRTRSLISANNDSGDGGELRTKSSVGVRPRSTKPIKTKSALAAGRQLCGTELAADSSEDAEPNIPKSV
jgi:hypothetical protein